MINIRFLAVKVLLNIDSGAMSNCIIDSYISENKLNKRDSSFLAVLVYSVLEHRNFIDYQIQNFSKSKFKNIDKEVLNVLRIGIASIYYINSVPNSASVNESVKLCKSFKKTSAKNFVNAILRKITVNEPIYSNTKDKIKDASINLSVSFDICKILYDSYGDCFTDIIKAMKEKDNLSIRVNTLKLTEDELLQKFIEKKQTITKNEYLKNNLFVTKFGDIKRSSEFNKGYFYVQDTASQLAMSLIDIKKGDSVIDACSSPGGKSFLLNFLTNDNCNILAFDKTKEKVDKINFMKNKLGIKNITTKVCDATIYQKDLEKVDIVVCDVPCSGIGVIHKKPEIRYKKTSEIENLYELQKTILQTCSKYVKSGGKLVYSTCTLNKNENENIVFDFLKNNDDFKGYKFNFNYKNVQNDDFYITMLPHKTAFDGFFIAILRKG